MSGPVSIVLGIVGFATCISLGASTGAYQTEIGYQTGEILPTLTTKGSQPAKVLFSITTTLHIPEKEAFLWTTLQSFIDHHPDHRSLVQRWFVINEYSSSKSTRASAVLETMQQQYPFIEFYQKGAHEQGQARSLNIILEELRSADYTYWLHIEESWRTVRPFLATAVKALDAHPYLHQVQLYEAAYYLNHTHTRVTDDIKVIALNSNVDLTRADPRNWRIYSYSWPSYSLRPSLTQVKFLRDHPELLFLTDPDLFPVAFELDFAIKWQLLGGSMCALFCQAIVRQEGHRSTYTLTA